MLSLSLAQARRIALAAQGFGDPRPSGRVDARHVRRVLMRIGLLQLDSVNVFCRSHYLPVFARLGPYPRELLDELSAHTAGRVRRRELFEYWAHEASLVPVEHQPLLRWRMARAAESAWPGVRRIAHEKPHLLEDILATIEADGPIRSSQTGIAPIAPRPGHMWNWHDGKIALEYLFYAGRVTAARRVNFERYYDLPERVLPDEILAAPTPDPADAFRELIRISARAHGVATEPDLRDYFRLSHSASKQAVAELVESGELLPVQIEGWDAPAWLWHEAKRPRRVTARALLSPFDPLVWFRDRTERLFGFRYRIEIYTPAPKRVYGYYVLPVLLGEELVGRVDLKSDRQAGVLRVQAAHLEDGHDPHYVATELAEELALTAQWLGLTGVVVMPRGELAPYLAAAVGQAA
ncbi:MAG TPA: winged helix-turn-helix domain-containing protein [Jatrophihabitans sp.]|jgi:hypothetical protein